MDNQKLREYRNNKGWTQGYAASQIGIQQSYLSKLENGYAIPSAEIIKSIAEAYEIDTDSFAPDLIITKSEPLRPHSTKNHILIISMLLVGLIFTGTAWFGLYKSNNAYTYELMVNESQVISVPAYLVFDEFKGEKFESTLLDEKHTYKLIGEREINPVENRWLEYIGFLLIVISLTIFLLSLGKSKRL